MNKGYGVRGVVNLTVSGASTTDAFGTFGYANAAAGTADYVEGARGEVQVTGTTVNRYTASTFGLVNGPSTGSIAQSFGMFGQTFARGAISNSYGGYGSSFAYTGCTVTNGYGLYGGSGGSSSGILTNSFGVFGTAGAGTNNYSVYGVNPGTGTNDWSGYFPGQTYMAGVTYTPSDENLKTNIAPLDNATAQLMLLDPNSTSISRMHTHIWDCLRAPAMASSLNR